MGEFVEWVKNWGLIDWTWPTASIFIIFCCAAGFIVAAVQSKRKKTREQSVSEAPSFTELHADALKRTENGDATAWTDLGYSYLYGLGCEQNAEKALKSYRKGAELSDKNACFAIYEMYGNGVSFVNDDEAQNMLGRAAELGHGKARFIMQGGD
jgi:hypothetical protein